MIYESNYYVGSDLNGDSLSHHGVPNQKWGVRNGPPYPVQRGGAVHYNIGKMTDKTKATLGNAAKSVVGKTSSAFKNWKNGLKTELAVKPTDNLLLKNWQKKQLRISDMTDDDLKRRIDRKRLEETYKHALRGDFSDPKTWKGSKGGKNGDGNNNNKGKEAADNILKRVGNAAVEGLTRGLSAKIEESMVTKSKAKAARKEARRDAMAEVAREAAKERAEYRAERRNEAWKERQERNRTYRESRWNGDDGAMDPQMGWTDRRRQAGSLGSGGYYAPPGSWTVT